MPVPSPVIELTAGTLYVPIKTPFQDAEMVVPTTRAWNTPLPEWA
jgi:hypothetical protein